jgi:hypothetical protein
MNQAREPAVNISVRLLRVTGGPLSPVFLPIGEATSDDRGEYRLFSIRPGRYYLSAGDIAPRNRASPVSAERTKLPIYSLQFYPGVTDINQAVPLEIASGREMRIDMILSHHQTYRVSGTLIDAASGKPPSTVVATASGRAQSNSLSLSLILPTLVRLSNSLNDVGTYEPQSGRFELAAPPGTYVIQAQLRVLDEVARAGGEAAWSMFPTARTEVAVVDRDIESVRLILKRPAAVQGRVNIQGGTTTSRALRFSLVPTAQNSADWVPPAADVAADWTFRLIGMIDGEYWLRPEVVPPGFRVKSVQYNGEDILNQPWRFSNPSSGTIDVVLAHETGGVAGIVTNARAEATPAQVLLLPEVRTRTDLYRISGSDQNGRFLFSEVAFGRYTAFAWDDLRGESYLDPVFLKRFEHLGKRIEITDAATQSFELRLITIP